MQAKRKTTFLSFAALVAAGLLIASTVSPALQTPEMMQMMKQKMMNRAEVMKSADRDVQQYKEKAIEEGKYNCCLKHPCDFCALKMGECPCGMNAENDQPVCNECKGSWYAGDGAVPDKTPEQIKTLPRPVG